MSAITGIFQRNGRNIDPGEIKNMNDKIVHRGPDGSKTWFEGSVALGHHKLYTTPESLHETLPFEDEESGLIITADARIDNRNELAPKLGIEDNEHISDSYFVLKAYEKWGEKCPEELLGDFAFAIWDKNKEILFCARDHMGVKPFYYYLDDEIFAFGTEIKAILGLSDISFELNESMVPFHFMPTPYEGRTSTFYKNIIRLPAAQFITISEHQYKLKKYWELDPDLKIKMDSDEDYVNEFLKIFNEAVQCRLRSSFPLGFELSGGLDSSSIVGITNKDLIENKDLKTFSLITDFHEDDERYYINKMADLDNIEPHLLLVDQISPLKDAKKIIWHIEQPLNSPNISFFWVLYEKMQNNNIRVSLSGYDGDSVLSHGQNYLKELALNFQIKTITHEIKYISERNSINSSEIFLNKILIPLIPEYIKKLWRINKKISKEGDFLLKNKELNISSNFKNKDYSSINPNSAKELHHVIITQDTHQRAFEYMDKISSAFCIEPRHPFFDKRLVEFCYAIPTEQKFKMGWDRILLRRAMKDILPEEIRWRPDKKHLTSAFEKNFLKFEKECLEELIYKKIDIFSNFADPSDVQAIYERYKKGEAYSNSDVRDIWNIITFMLWLQKMQLNN